MSDLVEFDLILASGQTVVWSGRDGVDASEQFAQCVRPRQSVMAFRVKPNPDFPKEY